MSFVSLRDNASLRPSLRTSVALLALALISPARADSCPLVFEQAHAPLAPPVASTWTAYGVLRNTGAEALTIRALRSPQFAKVELHETIHDGDVMRMRRIDPVTLASGASITLETHGKHLMLMRPTAALGAGDSIELVVDACPSPTTFMLPVRGDDPAAGNAHHHH